MDEEEAKLATYNQQLLQVHELLQYDAQNPEFLKLKSDLEQVIALTHELVKTNPQGSTTESSSTSEISKDFKSGPIALGENIEVSDGVRVYAGAVTDIINDLEYKIKYFEHDAEVMLPASSLSRIQPNYELLDRNSIKIGTPVQCKYSADVAFYDAVITGVTTHGYQVLYTAYGNTEDVPYEYLRSISTERGPNAATIAAAAAKSAKKNADPESSLITIPANLEILPTDTEEEKQKKRKKIKAIKSKNRLITKHVEVQEVQKTWQNFVHKSSKKKSMGSTLVKSASMFKSSESVEGKVGVVNSGKAMTSFGARKKYTFQDATAPTG